MKNARKIVVGIAGLSLLVLTGAALAHDVSLIKGTMGDDVLTGTPGHDRIVARAGNDTVNAGDGNDRVFGNRGNDTLNGDGGNDRMLGGVGVDTLNGGDGNDVLRGRQGDDTVNGGAGDDVIWVGGGADTQFGGDGDDRLHALARDRKVDQLDCGPGNDTVWLNANENDVHVNCETVKTVTVTGNGGDS